MERRALLSAEIAVSAPSGVDVTDGGVVDLNPLIGPVGQFPGGMVQVSFDVRNDGDTPMSLGPVAVTGDFRVVRTPGANLAAGTTGMLILGLNTTTAGTRTATVSIPNNDSDENPFDFQVSVDVIASGADISITNQAGTELVDGVTQVNFGSVTQGQPGPTQTFTVTNRGSTGLSFGAITLPAGFTLTKPLGQGLEFGGQDTFTVQLDSGGAVGTRTGVIRIPNNDPDENPFEIPVSGTVTAATPVAITVSSEGTNLVSGQTTVNFGSVTLGQPGPVRTFTVTNTGGSNLTLGALTVPAGFTVTEGLNTLLSPGASDTFSVQLDSSVAGTRTGSIRIPNNTTGANPFVIPVTGTVTTQPVVTGPSIVVQQGSTQLVNGSTTVNFGSVQQGQAGPVRTFTVINQGDQTLNVGSVTVPTGYTVTEPLNASLGPGTSDTFTVRLDSAVAGTKAGTIAIANNDPGQNPFNIPVTGTVASSGPVVTGPAIVVSSDGTQLASGVTPVNFGTALQGAAGPVRTLTVSNQGNQTLTVSGVTVPTGFTVTKALATSLAPGASDTLVLQMNTGAVGTRSGVVSIASNDPNVNPFRVPVTGAVLSTTPAVVVQVGSQTVTDGSTAVNFGTVGLGQPGPTRTFRVTNQGGVPMTLGAVNVPSGFTLVDGLSGTTLAPGASDTFVVQLTSAVLGDKTGTVTFNTNDPRHATFDIPVRGTVVAAVPVVTVRQGGLVLESGVTSVDFGTARQGSTGAARTFTVTNAGTSSLRLGALGVPSSFRVVEGLTPTLAPGASDTFTVLMATAVVGQKSGRIGFTTNDPNQSRFEIPVTGEVVAAGPTPSPGPVPGPGPSPGPTPVPGGSPEVAVRRGARAVTDGETTIRFGKVVRGRPGPMRTFTVTNTGSEVLRVRRVRLPSSFELVDGLRSRLAPGESDTFTVRMRTAAAGVKRGMARIVTNDAGGGPFEIRLHGKVRREAAAPPPPSASSVVARPVTPTAHLFSERLIEEVT